MENLVYLRRDTVLGMPAAAKPVVLVTLVVAAGQGLLHRAWRRWIAGRGMPELQVVCWASLMIAVSLRHRAKSARYRSHDLAVKKIANVL